MLIPVYPPSAGRSLSHPVPSHKSWHFSKNMACPFRCPLPIKRGNRTSVLYISGYHTRRHEHIPSRVMDRCIGRSAVTSSSFVSVVPSRSHFSQAPRFSPSWRPLPTTQKPGPSPSPGASKRFERAPNEFSVAVGQRCLFAGGSACNCARSYLVISSVSFASTQVVYPESNSPTSCSISNNLGGPSFLARKEGTTICM